MPNSRVRDGYMYKLIEQMQTELGDRFRNRDACTVSLEKFRCIIIMDSEALRQLACMGFFSSSKSSMVLQKML
ncbi:hypothetical protein GOP47_0021845 [Adiantum capillus-veneris]|uniref:Uncharacterized protein n=1 Tax=Adiantum capillus-veneris TaxID=13818 RepID=A0A9D4U898_ADICA|nr:hypothetical protein GOP47_0021845 [Adiantum capillus-veneris]